LNYFEDDEGLYFRYLFGSIIIASVLRQRPKSLVPEVMVSGLDLFQNASFVIVPFSISLESFNSRA